MSESGGAIEGAECVGAEVAATVVAGREFRVRALADKMNAYGYTKILSAGGATSDVPPQVVLSIQLGIHTMQVPRAA